ncbi:uncharacterized protein LOC128314825 [Acinonyx jubatus]|uniref:Uncharacterized protein LOC128314825 n=1 Tax=Acinonyx jubatus TaxID=32536 RepID=A0ABM3PSJ6_ACIJB|nr:uncharacterized protein LOC128314825 [Acinonyx jubatus]
MLQAIAYLSKQLDPTIRGWELCLRALEAAATLTQEAFKLTLHCPLTVLSPHHLSDLLTHKALAHFSPSGIQLFHLLFIENPEISLQLSPRLNPATLLPQINPKDTSQPPFHSCTELIDIFSKPPSNLKDLLLTSPDLNLFVDGSSLVDCKGHRRAVYTVVTLNQTLETQTLSTGTTSQKAELTALIRALQLSRNKRVTIYTDSKYAFLIAHTHSHLWEERGFLTTKGTPIINGPLMAKLLEALKLPQEVAIVHCKGHQPLTTEIATGNHKADNTARQIALSLDPVPMGILTKDTTPNYTPDEQKQYMAHPNAHANAGWTMLGPRLALPNSLVPSLLTKIHKTLHIGPEATFRFLEPFMYHPHLQQLITKTHQQCTTCAAVSSQGRMRHPGPTHQMRGHLPGEDWQIDFTHMPKHKKLRYVLTIIDTFTGWIEAFPTSSEGASTVAEILLKDIIPRFVLPRRIQSDNGPAFISAVTQQVSKALGITWKLHIPHHPQSSVAQVAFHRMVVQPYSCIPTSDPTYYGITLTPAGSSQIRSLAHYHQ